MNRVLGSALLLAAVCTADAASQSPERGTLGFYTGANVSQRGLGHPARVRFGISYARRLVGPVEIYPSLDLIPDALGDSQMWQANLHLRVWPFRRGTDPSFWYLGGGVVVRSSDIRQALVTGLTAPVGDWRPFVQFQIHGPGTPVDGEAELSAGFFRSLR